MVVTGVVLIALALAVVVLAPRFLTRSAWTIDRPRTALVSWSVAVLLGVVGFVAGITLVVLANLSGFDGSPDSMRALQLEYGAEIGRAIVNFDGRIVFVVVSRYHGGAFVVFSKALNPSMTVLAIEGSYASVLGGAPAAAVVFSRDVDKLVAEDERIVSAEAELAGAAAADKVRLAADLLRARSFADLGAERVDLPDDVLADERALDGWIGRRVTTAVHLCGTARMGPDPALAVVDARLRVHGTEGLMVADASAFPSLPGGNTNAPAILMGWRAGGFLRGGG